MPHDSHSLEEGATPASFRSVDDSPNDRFFERRNAAAPEPQYLEEVLIKLGALAHVIQQNDLKATAEEVEQDIRGLNERLVVSNELLTAANAELEAFSYSIAHDLRSPIRQIAGFTRILLEEYGVQLPAEARRYLDKVDEGARHMGGLVDDLLHLAQVGRQRLSPAVISLNDVVAAAQELLQPESAQRDIEWRIGNLSSIACDQRLMRLVFVNLLSNALKYTLPGAALIEVGEMTLDHEQVIFVRDNGIGFDMQYAGKLFGVFQRLHRTGDFHGTGIGLATVERIIRKHGGRIWAQASPGRGATFFFTLSERLSACAPQSSVTRSTANI